MYLFIEKQEVIMIMGNNLEFSKLFRTKTLLFTLEQKDSTHLNYISMERKFLYDKEIYVSKKIAQLSLSTKAEVSDTE